MIKDITYKAGVGYCVHLKTGKQFTTPRLVWVHHEDGAKLEWSERYYLDRRPAERARALYFESRGLPVPKVRPKPRTPKKTLNRSPKRPVPKRRPKPAPKPKRR